MKVVDLVTRNSDQLILNFSDFLRIYIDFTSSQLWKTKRKKFSFCTEAPGRIYFLADKPLAGL